MANVCGDVLTGSVYLAYYTSVRSKSYVNAEEDKKMIDRLAKKYLETASSQYYVWFGEFMFHHVEALHSGANQKFAAPNSKIPKVESLWYGFMMMVSFAMLNIEDTKAGVDREVAPLIEIFSAEENYAEHMQGLAWLLYGTLSQEVCMIYVRNFIKIQKCSDIFL